MFLRFTPAFLAAAFLVSTARVDAAPPQVAPTPAATLSLTTPSDWQVFQRSGAASGTIVVQGNWDLPRGAREIPDGLEARLEPDVSQAARAAGWTPLPFNAGAHGFRAAIEAPAGGWYHLQVRLKRAEEVLATADVAHVGVGEVFLIAGQSNSANYAEEKQRPRSGLVTAFDGARWQPADDPQPGATGAKGSFVPSFGDALVDRLHVPVGVICIGVGSTSVREWLPEGHSMTFPPTTGRHCLVLAGGTIVSSGELFRVMVQRLAVCGPHGLRAVLWHQGESDWHQPPGHEISLGEYRGDLAELIAASRAQAGWDVPWFVAQASYESPTVPGAEAFRAAQRAVADGKKTFVGPNTDTLTGMLRERNGQGVHFSGAGQRRHGELWADTVARWIKLTTPSAR